MSSPQFEQFWSTYPSGPRKVDKKGCAKKWAELKLDEKVQLVVANVQWHTKNNPQWRDGFVPMPKTYLNQARWDDGLFETRKPLAPGAFKPQPKVDEPYFSRYARYANLLMLNKCRTVGGFGEERLKVLLAKKDEIVMLAEREHWDDEDFKSVIGGAMDAVAGQKTTEEAA